MSKLEKIRKAGMILFANNQIEADFKGFPGTTDPRLIACILQLAAMHEEWMFYITSGSRTVEHNAEIGGVPDSGHVVEPEPGKKRPLTAFDIVISNVKDKSYLTKDEKQQIKEYLQYWWEDLFDFVIYNKDEHIHLEVDTPFRKNPKEE